MVSRLLSLALAWLVFCGALQAPDLTVPLSSSTSSQSGLPAADAAPPAALQDAGGSHALDPQHAQWHAEGAGDPQEPLCTRPRQPSVLLARDCHGPFVGPVLRAPYLDGLHRPPRPARLVS